MLALKSSSFALLAMIAKGYCSKCIPASMRTSSPVMLPDSGEARKHTTWATSSADEATLRGTRDTTMSRTCFAPASPRPLVNQGVSI